MPYPLIEIFLICNVSRKCSTTKIAVHVTSVSTTIKQIVINLCNTVFEDNGVIQCWSIRYSGEVLDKLLSLDCKFDFIESYDISTLYITLPHICIKKVFIYMTKWSFRKSARDYMM